jgi:hypothetical protein
MSIAKGAESMFINFIGSECSAFGLCDDPNSMWPSMATEQDVVDECETLGLTLNEIAPDRLKSAGNCPNKVLDGIAPGATKTPISILKNIHLRKQLGIEYIDPAKIIY